MTTNYKQTLALQSKIPFTSHLFTFACFQTFNSLFVAVQWPWTLTPPHIITKYSGYNIHTSQLKYLKTYTHAVTLY